jgi:hypothetical protein
MVLLATAEAMPSAASPPALAAPGVEIVIASATSASSETVRADVDELLSRRGIAARYRLTARVARDEVLRPAALAPCALACLWVDLGVSVPGRAFVYISATTSEQVVIRSVPLPGGVDEVAREEVSHIVATSVEALQAGRPLPAPSKAPDQATETVPKLERSPPPAPTVAPVASPDASWVLAGLGAGVARETASELALPTVSLSVLVGREHQPLAPALWLAAAAFASDATREQVTLRSRAGELAALVALGTSARRRTVARFGVGPGVEVREVTPALARATSDAQLEAARVDPALFVRVAARLEVRLAARVGLFATAACDARLVSHRYDVVDHDGVREASFQPERLRPSLVLGVDAQLAGGAP